MRLIDVESEGIRSTILTWISATLAPGKQCVVALKNRMRRQNESPIIIVFGGKSGRGAEDCEWPVIGVVLLSDGRGL